jgi:hypothetical protein
MGIAAAALGAGVLSAGASIYGAQTAAGAQENAAQTASNTQLQAAQLANQTQLGMFNKLQGNLAPYMGAGTNANAAIASELPSLTAPLAPISMNETALQQTPGYQFNLTQGLKSTQSAAAARGLGISGAALKGAASYATGLADSTYQNQFNNAQTNWQNQNTNRTFALNALTGQQSLGENAAAGVGNAGIATGNSIAANTVGAANSVASNTIGAGNAAGAANIASGNAVGTAANSALQSYTLNNLLSGAGGAGGGGSFFGNSAAGGSGLNSLLGSNGFAAGSYLDTDV